MIENYFNTQKRGILPKDDSLIRMMKYREKPLSVEEGREPKETRDFNSKCPSLSITNADFTL